MNSLLLCCYYFLFTFFFDVALLFTNIGFRNKILKTWQRNLKNLPIPHWTTFVIGKNNQFRYRPSVCVCEIRQKQMKVWPYSSFFSAYIKKHTFIFFYNFFFCYVCATRTCWWRALRLKQNPKLIFSFANFLIWILGLANTRLIHNKPVHLSLFIASPPETGVWPFHTTTKKDNWWLFLYFLSLSLFDALKKNWHSPNSSWSRRFTLFTVLFCLTFWFHFFFIFRWWY